MTGRARHRYITSPTAAQLLQTSYDRYFRTRLLVIWIAIAFWPARVARRKGHSFIGYFIFSLIFFPLAVLTAYLVHDRTKPAY